MRLLLCGVLSMEDEITADEGCRPLHGCGQAGEHGWGGQEGWPEALGVSMHLSVAWMKVHLGWTCSREATKTAGSTQGGTGEMLSMGQRSYGT